MQNEINCDLLLVELSSPAQLLKIKSQDNFQHKLFLISLVTSQIAHNSGNTRDLGWYYTLSNLG